MYMDLPETSEELMRRIGHISQIAGAKRYFLADGQGMGMECVDVRTGAGLSYTVMPGRGMDIGWCEYRGIPLSYISKVGMSSPSSFTGVRDQWRQCFPGGLVSTCGLSNVGTWCEDENTGIGMQSFGQHGRISNQQAYNVCVNEIWDGNIFRTEVAGSVREAQLRAENFVLRREVKSCLGESRLTVQDQIFNEDFMERPCMYLYHINLGYPLIDENARILASRKNPPEEIFRQNSASGIPVGHLTPPVHGKGEELHFYKVPDKEPVQLLAVFNPKIRLLVYIRYNTITLPCLTVWKMMGESDYVVGIEPGNCIPKGRIFHREHQMLPVLMARESLWNELEIGVVEGRCEIEHFIENKSLKIME